MNWRRVGCGAVLVAALLAVRPAAAAPREDEATAASSSSAALEDAPSTVLGRTESLPAITFPAPEAPAASTRAERRGTKYAEEAQRNTDCEEGRLHGKPCRESWPRVLGSSFIFLAAQHGGNLAMDQETRDEVVSGNFWSNYIYAVQHYRWSRWKDDDPFGVDWIGHPMMGAITNSMYEQNDPKQRALMFENTHRYWMGRLRALAYSAAYSAEWKIGPLSEASIGNTGHTYYPRHGDGIYTNETGMQDFFVTPIFGTAWNVGEDAMDRLVISRIRAAHPRNRLLLSAASILTPCKTAANVTRFRPLYYRDPDNSTLPQLQRVER